MTSCVAIVFGQLLGDLRQKIHTEFGVLTHIKDLSGEVVESHVPAAAAAGSAAQLVGSIAEAVAAKRKRRNEKRSERVRFNLSLGDCSVLVGAVLPKTGMDTCILDALAFLSHGFDLYALLEDGPHTYRGITEATGNCIRFAPAAFTDLLSDGYYILHFGESHQIGHAIGVKVADDVASVYDFGEHPVRTVEAEILFALLDCAVERLYVLRVSCVDENATPETSTHEILDRRACCPSGGDQERKTALQTFMTKLSKEVQRHEKELAQHTYTKRGQGKAMQTCIKCPNRSFHRIGALRHHVKKYHTKRVNYTADGTKQFGCSM